MTRRSTSWRGSAPRSSMSRCPAALTTRPTMTGRIIGSEAYRLVGHLVDDAALPIDPAVRPRIQLGRGISARDYLAALAERDALKARFLAALDGIDALLTPTTQTPAVRVESVDQTDDPGAFHPARQSARTVRAGGAGRFHARPGCRCRCRSCAGPMTRRPRCASAGPISRRPTGTSATRPVCRSGSLRGRRRFAGMTRLHDMHLDDFAFDLPRELIADRPAEPRETARLLVLPAARRAARPAHRRSAGTAASGRSARVQRHQGHPGPAGRKARAGDGRSHLGDGRGRRRVARLCEGRTAAAARRPGRLRR